jgi:hypothetical protein
MESGLDWNQQDFIAENAVYREAANHQRNRYCWKIADCDCRHFVNHSSFARWA